MWFIFMKISCFSRSINSNLSIKLPKSSTKPNSSPIRFSFTHLQTIQQLFYRVDTNSLFLLHFFLCEQKFWNFNLLFKGRKKKQQYKCSWISLLASIKSIFAWELTIQIQSLFCSPSSEWCIFQFDRRERKKTTIAHFLLLCTLKDHFCDAERWIDRIENKSPKRFIHLMNLFSRVFSCKRAK